MKKRGKEKGEKNEWKENKEYRIFNHLRVHS